MTYNLGLWPCCNDFAIVDYHHGYVPGCCNSHRAPYHRYHPLYVHRS